MYPNQMFINPNSFYLSPCVKTSDTRRHYIGSNLRCQTTVLRKVAHDVVMNKPCALALLDTFHFRRSMRSVIWCGMEVRDLKLHGVVWLCVITR